MSAQRQSTRKPKAGPGSAGPSMGAAAEPAAAPAPANQAEAYGVRVVNAVVSEGSTFWQLISVRHLLPQENNGRHHVFVDALDDSGQRVHDPALRIGWTWQDRRPDEAADPKPLDKPDSEPMGNFDIYPNQRVAVWIQGDGLQSDRVENMYTAHPDEPAPDGHLGNSYGHHSFHVVFKRTRKSGGGPGPGTSPDSREAGGPVVAPAAFRFEVWPTEFRTVTQAFGVNPDRYSKYGLPGHEGVDIVAPVGTKIFCVAPGKVKIVHLNAGDHNYGVHVRVLHAQGYETIYAHFQQALVQEGQDVHAGDVLGLADHTGNADGDHLHITLKHAGETQGAFPNNIVDPTPFLAPLLAGTGLDGATYVSDVIPDGTAFRPNDQIVEAWSIRNTGTSTWGPGYAFALAGGDTLGAPASVPLPAVGPGGVVNVPITFRAPATPGHYRSIWRARNAAGAWFGDRMWVDIRVVPGDQVPAGRIVAARDKLGIDLNAPIDAQTGAISPRLANPAIVSDVGQGWARLNFILGPWQDPLDTTTHQGLTWQQTYRTIIDGLRSRGLRIYGLISHEAVREDPLDQFRDPPPDGVVQNDWIRRYAETFKTIARLFHNDIEVFETFNEPDNWRQTNSPNWQRNWIHSGWFAIMLQEIAQRVRSDPDINGITIVSGPLEGLDAGNGARDYLRATYRAGKRRYGWGQPGAPVPFDGIAYHLYICSNPVNPGQDIPAKYNQYMAELRQVITDEDGMARPIYISEMGWQSAIGEDKQAACMRAGLQCLLNDPSVALGVWFCTQDFAESYGIYRQGDLSPANRKPAYGALQQICADPRTVPVATPPVSPHAIPVSPAAPAMAALPQPAESLALPVPSFATPPMPGPDEDLQEAWRQYVGQGLEQTHALFEQALQGIAAAGAAENAQPDLRLCIILSTYWSRLVHIADPSTAQADIAAAGSTALAQLSVLVGGNGSRTSGGPGQDR